MKKIFIAIIALLLFSCDFSYFEDRLSLSENPFTEPKEISEAVSDEKLCCLVLTDAHYNRELRDNGITRNEENLFKFLDGYKNLDAVFFLGDMIDDAKESDYERLKEFINDLKEHINKEEVKIISAPGNHDYNKGSNKDEWNREFEGYVFDSTNMGAYEIGDVMIYKLDSAYRMLGRDQLDALAEAVEKNSAKYNLIISHVPISLKGFDQGLFEFVLTDVNEKGKLLKILKDERAIYLSGHHHKGDVLNKYSPSFYEYVFPAFHKKDDALNLESKGYYHIIELNKEDGILDIYSFLIDNENASITTADKHKTLSLQAGPE